MRTLRQLDSAANQQREDDVRLRVSVVAQSAQALRERRPLAPVRLPEHVEQVHNRELSSHRNVSQQPWAEKRSMINVLVSHPTACG